ncbi:hypothetical protein NC652_020871 [Populus alba x Populus x berolinensis]|nr:hypothetical protein NC652_020871 [Populus alba x Populus x berolinensis]
MNVEINETDIISQMHQSCPKYCIIFGFHCPFSQYLFGLEMFAFPGTYEVNSRTHKFLNFVHDSLGLKNLELSGLINLGDVEVVNILYHGENQECHIDLIACKKNIEVVKLC